MTKPKFALSISLNVLEHLGIGLYSNAPSVLSEIVANAWDADAERVRIVADRTSKRFIIHDDGTGMTAEEVNERFLTVGHRRRDTQPGLTAKGRRPMGRKGIGKLSLFSIAGEVLVETVRAGEKSAFRMKLADIREAVREGGFAVYNPVEADTSKIDFAHGTRITLTSLHRNTTLATSKALRKRVARRFSVLDDALRFVVEIDGAAVTPADRGYYDKLQYLWTYGDQVSVVALATNVATAEARRAGDGVRGWLGTVAESRQLKDEDSDNLNRIAVFVRGKLAQEDVLGDFAERGVYSGYLIGELHADDFDIYDGPGTEKDSDSATSSRQRLVEDDDRYVSLKAFLLAELKHIQNRWSELRSAEGARKALEIPAVKAWIETLDKPIRRKAEAWLGKINRIRMDDPSERKQLIKHAVLGFEFYRLHQGLEKLDAISDESLPVALDLFKELDGLEATLYGQIVQQRVAVIAALRQRVDENALEKAIQNFLFEHLWLLDPSWERVESTELMERRVDGLFKDIDAGLTKEEKLGRLDIAYRKSAGQHVIVELKRPGRLVTVAEILDQVEKYLTGMTKLLDAQGAGREPVEIVVVLGKEPREFSDAGRKDRFLTQLQISKTRIVYYDQLLGDAERSYRDYLQKRGMMDALTRVMAEIDDYAPDDSV